MEGTLLQVTNLIAALAGLLLAGAAFLTALAAWHKVKQVATAVATLPADVREIKDNTNHLTTALVTATRGEGQLQGLKEERARGDAEKKG